MEKGSREAIPFQFQDGRAGELGQEKCRGRGYEGQGWLPDLLTTGRAGALAGDGRAKVPGVVRPWWGLDGRLGDNSQLDPDFGHRRVQRFL